MIFIIVYTARKILSMLLIRSNNRMDFQLWLRTTI
nr:MAG TPA: hypothetical protein [Caudoviricetes sp.]